MLRPAKRKFDADSFQILHEHTHELIRQHMSLDDVLASSEISSVWHECISNSAKCMSKICLSLEQWSDSETPKDMIRLMEALKVTKRKYQNVFINSYYDIIVSKICIEFLRVLSPSLLSLKLISHY